MIHVLILNWNGEKFLKKLMPSLLANLKNIGYENKIYIRDNGSKDDSINYLKNFDIEIFEIGHNRDSFSVGMNYLFDKTNAGSEDILLLLNNDIEFKDNTSIKKMLQLMQSTNAAICGARLMYENGLISHNGVVFSNRYGGMCWNYRSNENLNKKDYLNRYFQSVTAACSLIKVENFIKAGKFDTDFVWAFEDVALNLEILLNQKEKIVCCGETNIIHLTSASLNKNPINKLFLSQNVEKFKKKWFGKYKIDHEDYINNEGYNII